ncbi:RNA polymerase-associated rapA domain protein, partial [Vibrio parahaemolyticus V-223/04]
KPARQVVRFTTSTQTL